MQQRTRAAWWRNSARRGSMWPLATKQWDWPGRQARRIRFGKGDMVWRCDPCALDCSTGPFQAVEELAEDRTGDRWLIRHMRTGKAAHASARELRPYLRPLHALHDGGRHSTLCWEPRVQPDQTGKDMLECTRCANVAHRRCSGYSEAEHEPGADYSWVCNECVRCREEELAEANDPLFAELAKE